MFGGKKGSGATDIVASRRKLIKPSKVVFYDEKHVFSKNTRYVYLEIDDKNKLWRSMYSNNPKSIYAYTDILDVEIVLDKEANTSSGLGGMMLGGALFGGAGAVLGSLTDGTITRCRALGIKITLNDINDPMVYIPFIDDQAYTTTSSKDYKEKVALASECMALFSIIVEQNKANRVSVNTFPDQINPSKSESSSIPDEIMKYKEMLDKGIITVQEFERAKYKLLNDSPQQQGYSLPPNQQQGYAPPPIQHQDYTQHPSQQQGFALSPSQQQSHIPPQNQQQQNKKKTKYIILGIIAGVIILLTVISPLPVLFLVGVVFLITGIWIIRRVLKKVVDEAAKKKQREKAGIFSLFIIVGALMAGVSFIPLTVESYETIEARVIDNIVFSGIDENSTPLAAFDLKLQQGGTKRGSSVLYTYTVIGTLRKNSTNPVESFFEFNITLVDDIGRQYVTQQVDTMPSVFFGRDNRTLFTLGSTSYYEFEIQTSFDNQPVAVEFTSVKEVSKAEFMRITLDDAISKISNKYYNDATRVVNFALSFEPENTEAHALLEQIALLQEKESVEEESPSQEMQTDTSYKTTPADTAPSTTQPTGVDEALQKYQVLGYMPVTSDNLFDGVKVYGAESPDEIDEDNGHLYTVLGFGNDGLMNGYIYVADIWLKREVWIPISEITGGIIDDGWGRYLAWLVKIDDPAITTARRSVRYTEDADFVEVTSLWVGLELYTWNTSTLKMSIRGLVVEIGTEKIGNVLFSYDDGRTEIREIDLDYDWWSGFYRKK